MKGFKTVIDNHDILSLNTYVHISKKQGQLTVLSPCYYLTKSTLLLSVRYSFISSTFFLHYPNIH